MDANDMRCVSCLGTFLVGEVVNLERLKQVYMKGVSAEAGGFEVGLLDYKYSKAGTSVLFLSVVGFSARRNRTIGHVILFGIHALPCL